MTLSQELGRFKKFVWLVKDGLLSLTESAKRAEMTTKDFEMKVVGFA